MTHTDHELVVEFVAESREHLASVERQILDIEATGDDVDLDLINTVFRAVHSTKGAAGFLGFHQLAALAHEIENVLNLQRNRELMSSPTITDALLRAVDCLRSMVNDVYRSNELDVSQHVDLLQRIGRREPVEIIAGQAVETMKPSSPREFHEQPSAAAEANGAPFDRAAAVRPDEELAPSAGPATSRALSQAAACATGDASIRVPVGILDRLMNLAGELVLGRNQLLQVIESRDPAGLEGVGARVDQVTSELQEAIMHSRMQPIGNVFGKFSRIVRDLSNQLGKQCNLIVEGKDVELDKTILEAIADPLTHLIRNSLDHGVERPEVRTRAGKNSTGTIALRAFHQAGKVNIAISDDGAGMDPAKLKSMAVAKGVLLTEQAASLSDRDAIRLIFHPGFSTAETVSDVSGRGVGMDVVKTNIEKIGGTVEIDTELGQGTTIQVKLPLTLAIIPSLIIHSGVERFAIPQNSISELVRVKASEIASRIERVKGAEVLRLRGRLLPLLRLAAVLGLDSDARESQASAAIESETAVGGLNIIVVESELLRYGLVVDGLHDSEEIVVKPLGRHLKDCPCLAGATVLGDGQVALILDIAGIAAHTQLAKSADAVTAQVETAASEGEESQATLVFTNHPAEFFGVPMAVIKRIERVGSEQIETIGNRELLQYHDTSLPLVSLERHVKAQPRPEQRRLYVVVVEVSGREVGLIAPTLIDIRELSTNVDESTLRESGVVGSVVVERKAVRLLNIFELATQACPDLGPASKAGPRRGAKPQRTARILLAEDSNFFRKQVASFLESIGHEVVAVEDGQLAWDELSGCDPGIDLVVTDVEMPNMNGFELCRRIKDDPRWSHLPVIALTSLAGQEDVQRGSEAGIDDYQVKMDRDKLLASVTRLLAGAPCAVERELACV